MTNIGHFRAAGSYLDKYGESKTRLWVVPPTRMDEYQLKQEGYYEYSMDQKLELKYQDVRYVWETSRAADNTTMVSTSTRNFPNRMGMGAMSI